MRSVWRRAVTLAAAAVLLTFVVGAALGARPGGGAGTLTVSDATVVEGDTGLTSLSFTVQLGGPAKTTATVSYVTADGTATTPSDYA